jgi:hypothetical protein
MSFIKKNTEVFNDFDSLTCTASGCTERWSVRIDGSGPKCSYHAWKKYESQKTNILDRLKTTPVKPFVEADHD